jgi:DNA-binding NtrC family response regulator
VSADRTITGARGNEAVVGTDAGGNLVARRAVISIVAGPDRGAERVLDRGTIVVGSGAGADLVLTDRKVSRAHVELALVASGVRARDLGSRNGTWVGQARVESALLAPGAEVRIGDTRIALRSDDVAVADLEVDRSSLGALIAASPAMRRVLAIAARVAATDAPILIEGPAGAGKTGLAEEIHRASPRSARPIATLTIDATAGGADLADAAKRATGGTLVLDHVDRASAALAAAIVALLERREAGEIDLRPIATSRDPVRPLVEAGAFPRDLYWLVGGVRIHVPSLGERREDVARLVQRFAADLGSPGYGFSEEELAPFAGELAGNVRELRRLVEERFADAPPPSGERPDFKAAKDRTVRAFEREYLRDLLARHEGNISRAAAEAGIGRNHLLELARRHRLR